jgi:hypothetical protein
MKFKVWIIRNLDLLAWAILYFILVYYYNKK